MKEALHDDKNVIVNHRVSYAKQWSPSSVIELFSRQKFCRSITSRLKHVLTLLAQGGRKERGS